MKPAFVKDKFSRPPRRRGSLPAPAGEAAREANGSGRRPPAEDLSTLNLGAHHGLALLGLFNLAKVLPDGFESLEWVTETEG